MRKRFLSLFIGLALVLSFSTAVPCFAGTDETTIDGITYQYDTDTGKATVIGYEDGISINAEIKGIITVGGEGYDVKFIGDGAFESCSSLTSITIPEGVKSIGYRAFVACYGLKSITIPNSVTSIGDYAFSNCSSLTGITIPNSVTSIGDYAFVYCTALTDVYAPKDLDFGNDTFSYANQNLKVWRYEVLKSAEMSEDEKTHVKIVAVED